MKTGITFQGRLKELRLRDNLTQEELANKLRCVKSTVHNWENGGGTPNISMLFEICKTFNVSADWLIGFNVKENGIQPQRETEEYAGIEWKYDASLYFGNKTWQDRMHKAYEVFSNAIKGVPQTLDDLQTAGVRLRASFEAHCIRLLKVPRNEELEKKLCEKYGLSKKRTFVVDFDAANTDSPIQSMIGTELVAFTAALPENDIFPYDGTPNIAIAPGMTIGRFIANVRPSGSVFIMKKFVALTAIRDANYGNPDRNANAIANVLGSKFPGGRAIHMPFMGIKQQEQAYLTRNTLGIKNSSIRAMAETIYWLKTEPFSVYLTGVRVDSTGRLITSPMDGGNPAKATNDLYDKLIDKWERFGGVVGDVALDKEGKILAQSDLYCCIPPTVYQEMVNAGKPIWLIGAGKERFLSFHTALSAKIANGIVVTKDLASTLLKA